MQESVFGTFFEESGTNNKQTIVLLHGGGVSGWMWRPVAAILAKEYHVLIPDLPEQGRSREVAPFTHTLAADCVAVLIREHAHGGKATVIGLSEGAQVVVAMLSRCPQVIDHAVVSSAILRPMPGAWMYTRAMFKWAYRWFMAPLRNNDWWIRLNMHGAVGIGDEHFAEFKQSFQELSEDGFVNLMYEAMHFTLPAGLEQANLPVLVVTGNLEYKQMKDSARDLLVVLPRARGVSLSLGSGSTLAREHNWALTTPELFAAAVKAWIEDGPLPAELQPFA
jgi:pimeloyl-ACP methyl ester carboxylesterase